MGCRWTFARVDRRRDAASHPRVRARRAARSARRGGVAEHCTLDTDLAEQRYQVEPTEGITADKVYERRWALTLLDQTMARLRQEFAEAGKADEFARFKVFLTAAQGSIGYAEIAAKTGLGEGAVRVAVRLGRASPARALGRP